mmetsp:Transcript_20097/g.22619  ORF Transcript_20097/g.22619 Transcript_20097/m.22619 type:complete len:243 (-) Transcript_20097:701-1429(-)
MISHAFTSVQLISISDISIPSRTSIRSVFHAVLSFQSMDRMFSKSRSKSSPTSSERSKFCNRDCQSTLIDDRSIPSKMDSQSMLSPPGLFAIVSQSKPSGRFTKFPSPSISSSISTNVSRIETQSIASIPPSISNTPPPPPRLKLLLRRTSQSQPSPLSLPVISLNHPPILISLVSTSRKLSQLSQLSQLRLRRTGSTFFLLLLLFYLSFFVVVTCCSWKSYRYAITIIENDLISGDTLYYI